MKKFTIFLILALTLTAFLAGYVMVKRGAGPSDFRTGTILDKFRGQETRDKEQVEMTEEVKLAPLTDRRVISPTLSSDKSSILYFAKDTGRLFEFNLESNTEKDILGENLPDLIYAVWSPAKKEALASFNSPVGTVYKLINTETGRKVELDKNIRSAVFSPDSNLIAYYYAGEDSEINRIALAQSDGSNPKTILNTRLKEVRISWPFKDAVNLKTPSELFGLTEDGKLTKVVEGGLALEENWSPSGKKLLFSIFSNDADYPETVLWLKDIALNQLTSLEIPGSAYACTWSIDDINIYCPIPTSSSTDDIYRINTRDGSYKLIYEPLVIVREIILSPLEDQLFFVSGLDEKLYQIKISD